MKFDVIETDDIVIGKKNEIIKYLENMQEFQAKNILLSGEERIEEIKKINNLIKHIEDTYYSMDLIYLKQNLNKDIVVNYLDVELL